MILDLSEFEAAMPQRGPRCSMAILLRTLDTDRADKLQAALTAENITASAIARVLTTWTGDKWSIDRVTRHRSGSCRCE